MIMGLFYGPVIFASSDLEQEMQDVQKKSENLIKQLKELHGQRKSDQSGSLEDLDTLDEGSKQELTPEQMAMAQEQMLEFLKRYHSMSITAIKTQILEAVQKESVRNMMTSYPVILDFMAHMLKDPHAIAQMYKVLDNREMLKNVGLYLLGTLVLSFILGKILLKPGLSFFTRLMRGLFRFSLIWALRVGILVHFYGEYLGPAAKVFNRVVIQDYLLA